MYIPLPRKTYLKKRFVDFNIIAMNKLNNTVIIIKTVDTRFIFGIFRFEVVY
jgi:hypothetical protein